MLNEGKTRKFDNEYVSSYRIVEVLDRGNIKIKIRENRMRIVHIKAQKGILQSRRLDIHSRPFSFFSFKNHPMGIRNKNISNKC